MLSAWVPLLLVVLVLALIPLGLKWLQRRMGVVVPDAKSVAKVVSAVAVGPHQRVVTVEVGPEHDRVWLTLGVTAQSITCLHSSEVVRSALAKLPQPIDSTTATWP